MMLTCCLGLLCGATYGCLKTYMLYVFIILIWKIYLCFKIFVVSKKWKVDLKSKFGDWAVVTGCTAGIGRAYSHELAKRGMNLILLSRNMKKLKEMSDEIKEKYCVDVEVIEADFMKGPEAYAYVKKRLAGRDIGMLVNNVGVILAEPKSFEHVTQEEIWANLSVNMGAPNYVTHAILPSMIKNQRGAIINISSQMSMNPNPYLGIYSASKAYNYYFSEALRTELREHGIYIQTVTPGYVATSMTKYSETLSKTSLFCPSPEDFAADAVLTIGYADVTSGYLAHEFFGGIFYILPEWLLIKMAAQLEKKWMANLKKAE